MNEMQPGVLKTKSFDSQEKSETLALSGYFDPWTLRCEKRFQNYYFWMILCG